MNLEEREEAEHPLHLPSMTEPFRRHVVLKDEAENGLRILDDTPGDNFGAESLKEIAFGSVGHSFLFFCGHIS